MRKQVLFWMDEHEWQLKHPRVRNFWEWVVMPGSWGGRLGFMNWLRWATRG